MAFKSNRRLTNQSLPKKNTKIPLKRSLSGFELEMFTLTSDGSIDNSGKLLRLAEKKGMPVQEESVKSFIELTSMPHQRLNLSNIDLAEKTILLFDIAEKNGYNLYPFGTYPGKNDPVTIKSKRYDIHKAILGEENQRKAGLTCGYHQHYTLPRGMFDQKKRFIKYASRSKVSRTLVDSYNMLIAIDPILTLLLQSSPFVDNKFFAKDSRVIMYRGGTQLNYPMGVYAKRKIFGALPPYKYTVQDLISLLKRKSDTFKRLMISSGFKDKDIINNKEPLDYTWNPVKINKRGTLEYRGADANFYSIIVAVSTIIKFCLRNIQQDFNLVVPMDIEISDSFRVENNMIFIPPHSIVRNKLQKSSAYKGFNDKDLYIYTKNFFKFIKKRINNEYLPLIKPIQKIISKKESISDNMVKNMKKMGYYDKIPPEVAKEFALKYSKKYYNDLLKTKELIESIEL